MDLQTISKEYPESLKLLRKWVSKKIKDNMKLGESPMGISDVDIEKMSMSQIDLILTLNIRAFFEVFDKNFIVIEILYNNKKKLFYFNVEKKESVLFYESRVEAEKDAFKEAFRILENNLNINTVV